jgi:tetratricopeptide (TPR) repeat protein
MNTRTLLIVLLLLFSGSLLMAADDEIWNKANAAYDQGDYAAAAEAYTSFLERGHLLPEVYYNLGNSYFKQGKLGLAVASFHHSLKLNPGFRPAKENLVYVRGYAVDKVEEKPRGFLVDIWYGFASILSPQANFIVTIFLYWFLCAAISLLLIRYGKRELVIYLVIIAAFMFILSAAVTRFEINEERGAHWGVVIVSAVDLREGPGEEFEKIFTGHEGLEFKILSKRQNYCLVELTSGLKGWIPQASLMEI